MEKDASFQAVEKKPDKTRLDNVYLLQAMNIDCRSEERFIASLPFSRRDTSAGAENEFQAAVIGSRAETDLAVTIEESNYYKNIIRRAGAGDTSRKTVTGLERYLDQKQTWENSWVRFPAERLNTYARNIFRADLKSDKRRPDSSDRSDAGQFTFTRENETFIRVPVSYLLKLSLADLLGEDGGKHPFLRIAGERLMGHFSNDNTSPEIFSFHPVRSVSKESVGSEIARETVIRFVFTQLLVDYADKKFGLSDHGQQVKIFFSASPPIMQKQLNDSISDSFYRHLFMSPCLSGWSRGEEKHAYMKLCHKVLSRSQINGISKLKEAGIINSNLVVLPNSSNISLANNGTHISMGSRKLGELLKDPGSGIAPVHEKYLGDLAIKIKEHFLCLFPGTYSASPYRMDFKDFHPENALGFLPHELDYTHLRMIWRRWKKKAKISLAGKPMTPFGPVWLDTLISRLFCLKGDYLPDFRLVDYFVSLMSTDQSPALDGRLGNERQLKQDLAHMGVFNETMPLYQLVRNREFSRMGYSGFEHRYYSIFEDIMADMGQAADLQNLVTALAYQYILSGEVTHAMIPDNPDVESERRQIFFCSAIDLPTFYVKTKTKNLFLKKILATIQRTRHSRRYPGYTRIRLADYKKALVQLLRQDARGIIENLHLQGTVRDLESRLSPSGRNTAAGRLVQGITADRKKKNPMDLDAETFNTSAEKFYSGDLMRKQLAQGVKELEKELRQLELWASYRDPAYREALEKILGQTDLGQFIATVRQGGHLSDLSMENTKKLLLLITLYAHKKNRDFTE